ncbi:MAG TPA: AmmeMemoRadiSam system protein B [Desulfobacteraceae bacterium]|nr:AmmeMemoRadiSam system protein B [Desulfobacteraceae bacterium]
MHSKTTILIVLSLLLCLIEAEPRESLAAETADIHYSAIAGTWYPGDPHQLSVTIQGHLSTSPKIPLGGVLRALIVPHAGYKYSGAVAARAYRQLKGSRITTVILVGPSHYLAFDTVSVNLQTAYVTPLGSVPVDLELARKIIHAQPDFRWVRQAHAREHSLEIQLPFLQTVLGDFKIVPIVMGRQDYATAERLARVLTNLTRSRRDILLLASSDLSHYHPSRQARMLDDRFASRVLALDAKGLANDLAAGKTEACGGGPVVAVLLAARKLGATKAIILGRAHSGDVTGDQGRVVGYLSAALIAPTPK